MNGPVQNLADPMSTYNTSLRFGQEERERRDAERRTRVNKEYEKAFSSSSESETECKCKCKAKKLTREQLAYRAELRKRLAKFDRESRANWDELYRQFNEESICCTIL